MSDSIQDMAAEVVEEVGSPAIAEEETQEEELEASSDDSQEENVEGEEEVVAEDELDDKIKELKKKLKLKVDGQEIEEEVDLNDEENLTRNFQKAKAFDKKAQELAQMKKEVESLVSTLKSNPQAVLSQLGLNFDELAENHIKSQIEQLSKSPEQIEFEKMQKELTDLRNEKEGLSKEKEAAQTERIKNEQALILEQDIISSLNNAQTLLSVEDPDVVSDIARAMYRTMKEGYKDVTVADVIPQVEKRYFDKLQKRLELMDEDSLEKVLGKQAERLRKRRVSKKKAKTATAKQLVKETGASAPAKEEELGEKVSYKDFFRNY